MASLYDVLKIEADDDNFYFNIKGKLESLLVKIITSNKHLKEMININLSYDINDRLVHDSFAYKQYNEGLSMEGSFYTGYQQNDVFPWETWLDANFNDYSITIKIYHRFLKSKNVVAEDLSLLNHIYEKYN